MNQAISDEKLIEAVLSGNVEQYNVLVTRHKDYAYSIAHGILHNPLDAEEVAHDAFLKAYKSLNSFNKTAKFSTWLYRIVFNTAISKRRKEKMIKEDISEAYQLQDDTYIVDAGIYGAERTKYISEALSKLNPLDASLITLFYLKQYKIEEIGVITGISANNVKVKLFRARQKLAKELSLLLNNEVHELF